MYIYSVVDHAGCILYMLMDGGIHPANLQPYLEPVVEDMVCLEVKGYLANGKLWRASTLFFQFIFCVFGHRPIYFLLNEQVCV